MLSGLYELKNKEPFNLFLRIFLNILPALSFIFFSVGVLYGLFSEASKTLSFMDYVASFFTPIMTIVFWREMWLGKVWKKRQLLTNIKNIRE